jgi:hypothetical protein
VALVHPVLPCLGEIRLGNAFACWVGTPPAASCDGNTDLPLSRSSVHASRLTLDIAPDTYDLEGRHRLPSQLCDCELGRRISGASATTQKPSALLAWSSLIPGSVCIFRPLFSIFPGCIDRLIPHHSTPSRHYAYVRTLRL